tara:strand:- start:483 stop:1274 length:792 start_codon:yes stop_codon:yes gene_type:complete
VSQGLKIQEAHNLFRDYVDDPDATFISSAQVQRYLEFGLDEWREVIRSTNPHIYGAVIKFNTTTVPPSNYSAQPAAVKPYLNSLDLSNPNLLSSLNPNPRQVMGGTANTLWYSGAAAYTNPPIDTILDVYQYSSGNNIRGDRYRQVRGAREQELSMASWTYYLTGETMVFNGTPSESLLLEYFPIPRHPMLYTDNTNYIEDNLLPQFHELVVLLAAKRYMLRDQNVNQVLVSEMANQLNNMVKYLSRTRLIGSNDSVSVTMSF